MERFTQDQLSNMDYSKLLKVMLKDEHKIEELQENGQWMISVENIHFTLRMRLYISTEPLDALTMGVPTWSLRVTNNEGRQVMYSSNLQPQVSSYLGNRIMDAKEKYKKKSAEFDYANLEEYIKG
ncbi:MAG: hypothetical protein GOVbin3205_46 [Prokaryotic dsDNA virus sp.]|nr:MAG: hypothetical protein GOVbin3205_46 [Prokaryotic dsDNA virus sp.]|tara:strand:- start:2261 stop:2635 length:375 start_codon:yes stop_codon:yes gene_type:complete